VNTVTNLFSVSPEMDQISYFKPPKIERSFLSCIGCNDPVQIFNSQKGRIFRGLKRVEEVIDGQIYVKHIPMIRTGRVCSKCLSKAEILPDEFNRRD